MSTAAATVKYTLEMEDGKVHFIPTNHGKMEIRTVRWGNYTSQTVTIEEARERYRKLFAEVPEYYKKKMAIRN